MGCVRIDAGADAVVLADEVGEGLGGGGDVHHGEAVGLKTLRRCLPAFRHRDGFELDAARVPAEGAGGLSREGVTQARFGDRQHLHDAAVDALGDLASEHGFATVGDHDDHQRPEAQHDAQQGRHITQEPERPGPTFHGQAL
jgi:hypothetical protein